MRKRKISLEKKLSLKRETIAALNAQQQALVAGGAAPLTIGPPCAGTQYETCITIPPNRDVCIMC